MPQPSDFEEWCEWHLAFERRWPGDFRFCGDCGHSYRTEYELLTEVARLGASGADACPRCGTAFYVR